MTLLTTVLIAACLSACSNPPARPEHTTPGPATSSLLSLSCPDSAGQQGADHEAVVGGVEGLVLPGSDDPAGLYPIGPATGGKRYFIYKTFLAVSASAAPFATVSVTGPADARLVYGSPSRRRAVQRQLRARPHRGLAEHGATARVRTALHRLHRRRHRHRARLRHLRGLLAIRATSDRYRPDRPGQLLNTATSAGALTANQRRRRTDSRGRRHL